MTPKAIITGLLSVFVVASVGYLILRETGNVGRSTAPGPAVSGSDAEPIPHRVVGYYFHGNARCQTCRKIEAYTAESLQTSFTNELASGQLVWKVVNVDDAANAHAVKDYNLTTRSVVLADTVDGTQVRWKNLSRIWELVGTKSAFQAYIIDETRDYLTRDGL